ncbi:MAG: tRNA pseudouridine(55) synthase TruB [Hyphomicrobium sp.]
MARHKKGNPIHGWLVLDKPLEMTSTRAVGIAKRLFFAQKAGHAGTLDPLATGILPIALGEATKTVPFVFEGEKVYRFTVRWGAETSTDDAEGPVVASSAARPTRGDIEDLLPRFTGEIMQVPPAFSAIKVDGERAYNLARDGEEVVLEPRPVFIDELILLETPDADTAVFEARCGKGTYVRAIARDMGRMLGCRGHVIALRRTRVGPFREEEAVSVDELEDAAEAGEDLMPFLRPVELALGELFELNVSPADAADLLQGRSVLIRGRDAPVLGGSAYAMHKGRIVAVGEIEKGALHPTRVFNFG